MELPIRKYRHLVHLPVPALMRSPKLELADAAVPPVLAHPTLAVDPQGDVEATDRPAWLDQGRIPCLDGLRALSIGLVVAAHLTLASGFRPSGALGAVVRGLGAIGVDIFFTISGFLITTLLLREWRRRSSISLKAFYIRRFLRIMPAAIAFLIAVFSLHINGQLDLSGRNWLHVLTYTVNFDPAPAWETWHLWSLSIEEHFYVLWPLALVMLGPRAAGVLAFVWLLCGPFLRLVVLQAHPQNMGDYVLWTPLRIDCISAGCLLALLSLSTTFRQRTAMSEPAAMTLVGSTIIMIAISSVVGDEIYGYSVTLDPSVRAACIAALVWASVNHHGSLWGRLLESKPFVVIGLLSYSLYLWQQPFLKPNSVASVGDAVIALALTLLCAVASYKLIEQPFLRMKEGAKRPIRPPAVRHSSVE